MKKYIKSSNSVIKDIIDDMVYQTYENYADDNISYEDIADIIKEHVDFVIDEEYGEFGVKKDYTMRDIYRAMDRPEYRWDRYVDHGRFPEY